jgi:hypothetical protein
VPPSWLSDARRSAAASELAPDAGFLLGLGDLAAEVVFQR